MSILFTTILTVGLLSGWFGHLRSDTFEERFIVWSCISTGLIFGIFAELLVATWRLEPRRISRWKGSLRHIATNWALALGVGVIVMILLALPLLDSVNFVQLAVSVLVLQLVAVCALASVISARRNGHSPTPSVLLRGFGNFALLNVISMVAGVVAGSLYIIVLHRFIR
jgi:hypothetical protein